MRHKYHKKKFGRLTAHREAMMRNLVTSLLKHEKITTTDAKAKELRRLAEKMITLGKRGSLHARRQALAVIRERDVVEKVFGEMSDRYRERPGGYTRILKLGERPGDAAEIVILELVDYKLDIDNASDKKAKKKAKKASAKENK